MHSYRCASRRTTRHTMNRATKSESQGSRSFAKTSMLRFIRSKIRVMSSPRSFLAAKPPHQPKRRRVLFFLQNSRLLGQEERLIGEVAPVFEPAKKSLRNLVFRRQRVFFQRLIDATE